MGWGFGASRLIIFSFMKRSVISLIISSFVAVGSRIHAVYLNWLTRGRSVGSSRRQNSISDLNSVDNCWKLGSSVDCTYCQKAFVSF